jgi:membrane-associated phospholipid phosphatase
MPRPPTTVEFAFVTESGLGEHRRARPGIPAEPAGAPSRWWIGPAVTAAACVVVLALMTWQVLVSGPFVAWDWPFHEYVDARQPSGPGRVALDVVASVGGQRLFTLPVVVGVAAYASWRQGRLRPLAAVVSGLATVFFVGYALKFGLGRTPPARGVDVLHGDGQAFPSGHTANATLTWTLVVIVLFGAQGLWPDRRRYRWWMAAALVVVVVSGALMTLLDYHWLSDIFGGWVLGVLALMVALMVLGPPRTPRRWR